MYFWDRCYLLPPLANQEIFCNKPRTLLSSLYVHLTQCVELLSKYLEANFKHLPWKELATDASFLVLSSVNNYLSIYVFATSVGCEIIYVGTTKLRNNPYIRATVTCTINLIVKETSMFRLEMWMLSFLEGSKYLT